MCFFIGSSTSNYFYVPLRQVYPLAAPSLPTGGPKSTHWWLSVYLLVALSLPTGGSQSTYWWLSVYLLVALSLHKSCLHFREHYVNNSFSPSIRTILRLVYIKRTLLLYTHSYIKNFVNTFLYNSVHSCQVSFYSMIQYNFAIITQHNFYKTFFFMIQHIFNEHLCSMICKIS